MPITHDREDLIKLLDDLCEGLPLTAMRAAELNKKDTIDVLSSLINDKHVLALVQIAKTGNLLQHKLAISALRARKEKPEIRALFFNLWDDRPDPDVRVNLLWRLLDYEDIGDDWRERLYLFVNENWDTFIKSQRVFMGGKDQGMVLAGVEGRLNNLILPESKTWAYLCAAMASSQTERLLALLEKHTKSQDRFTARVAKHLADMVTGRIRIETAIAFSATILGDDDKYDIVFKEELFKYLRIWQWEVMCRDIDVENKAHKFSYLAGSEYRRTEEERKARPIKGLIQYGTRQDAAMEAWKLAIQQEVPVVEKERIEKLLKASEASARKILDSGVYKHNEAAFDDLFRTFSLQRMQKSRTMLVPDGLFSFFMLYWFLLGVLEKFENSAETAKQAFSSFDTMQLRFSVAMDFTPLLGFGPDSTPLDIITALGLGLAMPSEGGLCFAPRWRSLVEWMRWAADQTESIIQDAEKKGETRQFCVNEWEKIRNCRAPSCCTSCSGFLQEAAERLQLKQVGFEQSPSLCRSTGSLLHFFSSKQFKECIASCWEDGSSHGAEKISMVANLLLDHMADSVLKTGDGVLALKSTITRLCPAPYIVLEHCIRSCVPETLELLVVAHGEAKLGEWNKKIGTNSDQPVSAPLSLSFVTFGHPGGHLAFDVAPYHILAAGISAEITASIMSDQAWRISEEHSSVSALNDARGALSHAVGTELSCDANRLAEIKPLFGSNPPVVDAASVKHISHRLALLRQKNLAMTRLGETDSAIDFDFGAFSCRDTFISGFIVAMERYYQETLVKLCGNEQVFRMWLKNGREPVLESAFALSLRHYYGVENVGDPRDPGQKHAARVGSVDVGRPLSP